MVLLRNQSRQIINYHGGYDGENSMPELKDSQPQSSRPNTGGVMEAHEGQDYDEFTGTWVERPKPPPPATDPWEEINITDSDARRSGFESGNHGHCFF
jgi:hypothetical protein